jgi:two-component system C4-dicarboxylate transport sensor histidine kinase DctB
MEPRGVTRSRQVWTAALAGLVCLCLIVGAARLVRSSTYAEGHDTADGILRQTINALEGHLRRFETLPALLASQAEVRSFLASVPDAAGVEAMNRWLQDTNRVIESSNLYLIAPDGTTLAASNHDQPNSFLAQNFAYRPYFTQAMAGGPGRFFALGTTSGVRGYYFASPVRDDLGRVVGVVALKIGVEDLETSWQARTHQTLVTDPKGIVFMATDRAWLFRAMMPLTPDQEAQTAASRRYADQALAPLGQSEARQSGQDLVTLVDGSGGTREYLVSRRDMPAAGWTVQVLLDTAPLRAQIRLTLLAFVMFLGVALLLGLALWQRRARLKERIAMQARAQAELESQVAARTVDLRHANDELHRIQADLVQAGKLAALGRMSAALSHEINQPLAAARNYADSAAVLIDRGEPLRARANLDHILSLIDRMATIARHLRNVARKPDEPLKTLALGQAVTEALTIAEARLAASGVRVRVTLPDDLPLVLGGPVRLQQVIVNLLSNAADAMDGVGGQIDVAASLSDGHVTLTVRDHGPGVSPAIVDRIFDPFFTTKTVGSGLGLGLSISYNICQDFGGDLRVANHPAGGAVFSVVLRAAPVPVPVAARALVDH